MADFAGKIFDAAQGMIKQQQEGPGFSQGLQEGAALAAHAEKVKQQRAALEQKQQEIQQQKLTKFGDTLIKGANIKDPSTRNSFLKNFIPKQRDALGLTEQFPDDAIQFAFSSDENVARIRTLESQVRRGTISAEEAYATMANPESFIEVTPAIADQFSEAEEQFLDRKAQVESTQARIAATREEKRIQRETKAQQSAAQTLGTQFGDYTKEKGAIPLQLESLNEVVTALKKGKIKTGTVWQKAIGGSDFILDLTNPDVASARDQVRTTVVATLRPILGAQFAEAEGKRILDLAFNPKFSSSENAKRIAKRMEENIARAKAREEEFIRQGLMTKEDSVFLRSNMFKGAKSSKLNLGKLTSDAFAGFDQAKKQRLADRLGTTVQEIEKQLKGQ